MLTPKISSLAAALLGSLLLFAGSARAANHAVTVNPNFTFTPASLTIAPGDTVTWTWAGGTHTVSSGANCLFDGGFTSAAISTIGTTFTSPPGTYDSVGSYDYHCAVGVHCSVLGMAGTITVEAPAPSIEPSGQEQFFIYELNRARNDPPAWAIEVGIDQTTGGDGNPSDLTNVVARSPLAINQKLVDSTRFHATEMAENNYFAHTSPVTGDQPNKMVRDAGYLLPLQVQAANGGFFLLPDAGNSVESLAAGFGPGSFDFTQAINPLVGLIVDSGIPSLGHRNHLLGANELSAKWSEAGAALASNSGADLQNYWAIHTGLETTLDTFVTGVVFDDLDSDGLYDPGEGLSGVTVTAGASQVTTNAAGGYSIKVTDGTHVVQCSGGGFSGSSAIAVAVSGANREVDFESGNAGGFLDFASASEALDTDGDGVFDVSDNCTAVSNAGQEDADADAIGDLCDVCPSVFDPSQTLSSTNGTSGAIGMACLCGDADATGTVNLVDAQALGKISVGLLPPSSVPADLSDVDRSGTLNLVDAQTMGKVSVGIIQICNVHCTAAPNATDADFVHARAACP